jgi:hypothetical protein
MGDVVVRAMDWCGCGEPERIDALMLEYLSSGGVHGVLAPADTDLRLLLAAIADGRKWTEHGSSVNGAWLTYEGERIRAELARASVAETVG